MKHLFPQMLLHTGQSLSKEISGSDATWKMMLMRKVGWVVIFAYTLMIVKPVVPVFMDAMAHTFWQTQHMMVHEEHGQFHVHYEVMNASGNSGKDKTPANHKTATEDNLYVISTIVHIFSANTPVVVIYSPYKPGITIPLADMNYPPPKA